MKQKGSALPVVSPTTNTKTLSAYLIYMILFIMAITIGGNRDLELFSLSIFFVTNLFFTITLGNDIFSYYSNVSNVNELYELISPFLTLASLLLEFVSSILLVVIMNYLKKKFNDEDKQEIELQKTIREKVDNIKLLFIFSLITISFSALGIFHTDSISLDKMFLLSTGSMKYFAEFVLICCFILFVLASYILYKLNHTNIPNLNDFTTDYKVLYSIALIYMAYIPFRIATRQSGIFDLGGILDFDMLFPFLNVVLILLAGIFFIKMCYDGTLVYTNASKTVKETLNKNIGVLVALAFILLFGVLLLPGDILKYIIKYILPVLSVTITSYLTYNLYKLATINNKIIVK